MDGYPSPRLLHVVGEKGGIVIYIHTWLSRAGGGGVGVHQHIIHKLNGGEPRIEQAAAEFRHFVRSEECVDQTLTNSDFEWKRSDWSIVLSLDLILHRI